MGVTALLRPRSGFEALLRETADALGKVHDIDAWTARVARWLDLVVDWNRRIDLTAARGPEELVDLAVADALVLAGNVEAGSSIVDVGSGFGGPGLGLALTRPDLSVALVEPKRKRAAFLRTAVGAAQAANATVHCARVEQLVLTRWDAAVARATFSPERWLQIGSSLAPSVWVLLADGAVPASSADFEQDRDVVYRWPLTGVLRRVVVYTRAHQEP